MFNRNFVVLSLFACCSTSWANEALGNLDKRILSGVALPAGNNGDSVASIRFSIAGSTIHIGGGFIINRRWVGTSAQLLQGKSPERTVVAVGRPTVTGGTMYNVDRFEIHQNYNNQTLANDIALLRTTEDIIQNANVRPIPLGEPVLTSYSPNVYGWGRLVANGGLSNTLTRATFNTVLHGTCVANFPYIIRRFIHSERQMCISSATSATCDGDVGGPIIFNGAVVGIVSWAEPCVARQVSVHTRISFYVNWILRHTRPDN